MTPVKSPFSKIRSTNKLPYTKKPVTSSNNREEIVRFDERSSSESDVDSNNEHENDGNEEDRRYPLRNRVQRQIQGGIPWDQVPEF